MDRVYKEDIPALIGSLEGLSEEFAGLTTRTDWGKLRIEPLLQHARTLHHLLRSPAFSQERSRLTVGVVMFRSDLIYLRENVKALRAILKSEKSKISRRPLVSGDRKVTRGARRKRGDTTA